MIKKLIWIGAEGHSMQYGLMKRGQEFTPKTELLRDFALDKGLAIEKQETKKKSKKED